MLVERDALLDGLAATADEALAGSGRLVFVGGEAGVGKSALVRALAQAIGDRCPVRIGGADSITTAEPLAALSEAMPEITPLLNAHGDRVGLFRAIRAALVAKPGLLVLEDLHWADEATLDALRFLGRRLDGLPVLIVGTYRDDETAGRHPLATAMGELASTPGVRRIVVPPLSVAGVGALAERTGAAVDAVALHARTDGNAFFITELLASGAETMPSTVSDAIHSRVALLPPAAQDAASAAAVLGTAAGAGLIAAVAGGDPESVDACVDAGVLVTTTGGFAFRHELARQAVELGLSAVRRRQLHARALRELEVRAPEDHRRLAHHAAACGDDDAAAHHATLAAQRAAQLSAHREAAEHYRTALRHGVSGPDRAELFVALSYECYLTDQLREAITARQRALELHELVGDRAAAGDDERWLSRLSWFLGRGADAERYGTHAVEGLEPLGPSSALAMAYSNVSQLRMLAKDNAEAEKWGAKALAMASRIGDRECESHALNNMGTAALATGRVLLGEARLRRSLDIALAVGAPEHAARAYTNLVSCAVESRRYAEGLASADAGIAYCEERGLDSWVRYMRAWRGTALGEVGRFDEALADTEALLAYPDVAPVSAIPAAAASARVLARRGGDASDHVRLAMSLAAGTRELQRVGPAASAAAEVAWLQGDTAAIRELTDAAWALALAHEDEWITGELAWWRTLGGIPSPAGVAAAQPFALMLTGEADAAAAAWDSLGSPVWASYARMLAPGRAAADRAVRALDALGAVKSVHAVLRTRRDRGLALPRRPRATALAHPAGLTTRELDVLRLLSRGLSTADIAGELVVSPKTAEHHISAVLHKLGEPTRARAVAAALRMGAIET